MECSKLMIHPPMGSLGYGSGWGFWEF